MNELEFRLIHEIDKLQTQLDATRDALRFAAVEVEFDEEGMPAVTRSPDAKEVERLSNHLHAHRAHPDYEYCTTVTGRKTSEDPRDKLASDGWEPNNSCTYMVDGEVMDDSWERFDYHEEYYWEEYYWRRKK